jgi:RNA polymerase sigma factor (sigma-70 family)
MTQPNNCPDLRAWPDQRNEVFIPRSDGPAMLFFSASPILSVRGERIFIMRFLKTNSKSRTTYKYYELNKKKPACVLKPGENGVTEVIIHLLHRMDDRLVYNEIKNHRPPLDDAQKKKIKVWKESFIQKFEEENHRPPTKDELRTTQDDAFPKNWTLSFNQLIDTESGGLGDKSHLLSGLASDPFAPDSEPVERLREIVEEMPERWREIYNAKYIEGYSNVAIAKTLGVTESAVRKTLRKIRKRIAEDPELQKFYSMGTNPD